MRRKKIEGILCLTGMLLLTGCGTKAYDLTEAEESQIVNTYSSIGNFQSICSKYIIQRASGWCLIHYFCAIHTLTARDSLLGLCFFHALIHIDQTILLMMYLEQMDWKLPMEE